MKDSDQFPESGAVFTLAIEVKQTRGYACTVAEAREATKAAIRGGGEFSFAVDVPANGPGAFGSAHLQITDARTDP